MSLASWRRAFFTIGLLTLTATAWRAAGTPPALPASAQDDKRESKSKPTKSYYGSRACKECHDKKEERVDKEYPPLCRCTEFAIWEKEDKHRQAFKVLLEERAQRMGQLLGGKNVSEKSECLACHSIAVVDEKLIDKRTFDRTEGVTCGSCHGFNEDWIDVHGPQLQKAREKWRGLKRSDKESIYGMTDLWNSATRAHVCLSCHIGNTVEGKVVTHAMYAAGHPPLPSIELATFSEQMPRHWQYIREKTQQVQGLLNFKKPEADSEQSKLVMVSSAVALRESLNLLATQADECLKANAASGGLDYALFDCAACHHELKVPGWRQARGYVGKPGRPQMQVWPMALTKIGLTQIQKEDTDLHAGMKKLGMAFDVRPFGDPARVATAASELVRWMDGVIERLNKSEFDEASVRKLQRALGTFKDNEVPDYESARQRAWAFVILADELGWKNQSGDEQRRRYQQRLHDVDTRLDRQLLLELPSGQNAKIMDRLGEGLKRMGDYNPGRFVPAFRKLVAGEGK